MSRRLIQLSAGLVLALWTAPCVGALGLGLHVAFDHHHGEHGVEHGRELADLVRTASHGHHHDLEAGPDHDHDVRLAPAQVFLPHLDAMAVLPAISLANTESVRVATLDQALRRGPPRLLLAVHCVLLT